MPEYILLEELTGEEPSGHLVIVRRANSLKEIQRLKKILVAHRTDNSEVSKFLFGNTTKRKQYKLLQIYKKVE